MRGIDGHCSFELSILRPSSELEEQRDLGFPAILHALPSQLTFRPTGPLPFPHHAASSSIAIQTAASGACSLGMWSRVRRHTRQLGGWRSSALPPGGCLHSRLSLHDLIGWSF